MNRILGIGNALVDIMTRIDNDAFLESVALPKGSMQLVDHNFIESLRPHISGFKKSMSAGGSAANTINGLAHLGIKSGFIGVVGDDDEGHYFADDMKKAGIVPHLFTSTHKSGVAVAFVSPDSERTFATFLGAAIELNDAQLDDKLLEVYDLIYIEGYLVQNYDLIKNMMLKAKAKGLKIALDLASYNIVEAHLDFIKHLVEDYVDIVFANEEEAKAYTGKTPREALDILAEHTEIAIVKTGPKGSIIKHNNKVYYAQSLGRKCIDSTGAGDLYAAGFLYGLVNKLPVDVCGKIGSIVSGHVIEVIGSKIDTEKWVDIKKMIKPLITNS